MSEPGITDEDLEQALRTELGEEGDFLVDLVMMGLDAEDFAKSKAGRVMLKTQLVEISVALDALANPSLPADETQQHLRQYQVARAVIKTITDAIGLGRNSGRAIETMHS